ncbi:MAG TPA: alkaline phosphatase D family protein [Candidatus Binatus sp.]|nr:alkaline phosphatase D family protein [Candidatus Binatus sp.]
MAASAAASHPLLPWNADFLTATESALAGTGLLLPCAVGDVSFESALVWLKTDGENTVAVAHSQDPALANPTISAPLRTGSNSDFTAKVLLRGLESGQTYFYRAVVDGKRPGPIAHFVTAPPPEQMANVQFAFSGDSRFDYQPFAIMDAIREKKPDFFLHLGDTIYADRGGRARQLDQFRQKYIENRQDAPTQRLLAETSLLVVWDDHEVEDNYRAENPLAPIGRQAFFDYWPVRRDGSDGERIYRAARWGRAAELFLVDTRQYRSRADKTMLGKRQKQWLLDSLVDCAAHFKFICTSVPFTGGADKWGDFAQERDEIVTFIEQKKIAGVIFLSADVHYAAVARVPGASGLKEIITGPLAATFGKVNPGAKRFEFASNQFFNYGLVQVHTEGSRAYVEVEILTDKNVSLHKLTIQ